MTPFKALYGCKSPVFLKLEDSPSHVQELNEQIRMRNVVISKLKGHLTIAQERMKLYANKKRRDV